VKKFSTISLFVILLQITINGQNVSPWRLNESQITINTPTIEEVGRVAGILQSANRTGYNISYEEGQGFVRCYTIPSELDYLVNEGLNINVEIPDLNEWSASFGTRGVPGGYYTFAELNEIADSLATNFPSICTKHFIGNSSYSDPMYVLKISDNSGVDENEPELMFDGGIHGDEIGGPENLIRFARDLCLDYGNDPEITDAVNNSEIWILYCVNPYGRNYMTRYNANGIDVNRDFGYMWDGEGGSVAPFSQPETRLIRNLLLSHRFVIHISYHSGTEFISYPWSYRADLCPDDPNHTYLAQQYASNSGYTNIPYGPGNTGMYPINGASKDYGYGGPGSISWSVEISLSKQPPSSQITSYYLKNKESMLTMISKAYMQGINGVITDAETGKPVSAIVTVGNFFPLITDTITGDFHKFLVPGTYNVTVKANGYITQTITGVNINNGLQTELNVQMIKGGGYFGQSVITCYIPNDNPNDEGNTPAIAGKPDSVAYSIGRNGGVIIDMGTSVLNRMGNDIKVYENDLSPEGYKVFAANTADGPWLLLGQATGTASFDLSNTFLNKTQFIKVLDDGDGSSQIPDAGFDLDAIENLHPDTLTVGWISGIVYDSQEPPQILPGASFYINDNLIIADENGSFSAVSTPGEVIITAFAPPFYNDTDTVLVTLGDTLSHDMHLIVTESVKNHNFNRLFTLSPVPAGHFLTINGPDGNYFAQIYNSKGDYICSKEIEISAHACKMNISELTAGLYIIVLRNDKMSASLKFIKRN